MSPPHGAAPGADPALRRHAPSELHCWHRSFALGWATKEDVPAVLRRTLRWTVAIFGDGEHGKERNTDSACIASPERRGQRDDILGQRGSP